MRQFGILADDLTGSMDTGLQFLYTGLPVVVHLRPGQVGAGTIPVLDTESRHDDSKAASARARRAARLLEGRVIYKKIDSTLRGNIGPELEAVIDELHLDKALVCPAFPAGGRTMRDGHLLVRGLPLRGTDFAADPLCPPTDHVPSLLQDQCQRAVGHVGLDTVAQGVEALLAELGKQPGEIVVVDAGSDTHLGVIASAAAQLGPSCVSCGSAGLAQALSAGLGCASSPKAPSRARGPQGPVLVVAGSRREETARQIEMALSGVEAWLVEIDPQDLTGSLPRAVAMASQRLASGLDTIVTPAFRPYIPHQEDAVARHLGEVAARLATSRALSGLVLTGGAVAFSVCRALGIARIEIETELAPGVPSGKVLGGSLDGLRLVTKAGGFGDADTLVVGIQYLRGGDTDE
jgi:uncharacterized protein YgbK (DUF1537 family)